MKVKASLIVSAVGILKAIDTTAMKLSTSYKVRTILNECQTAVEDFEAKRLALAEQHGTLDGEGVRYEFEGDEAKEAFQTGMNEMLEDEINIKITPIHIDLIDEYVTIEPQNVNLVEWFVEGLEA